MRYLLKIIRIQSAERSVSADEEESAVQKIQAEIDKPYGFLGSWTTEAFEVEVLRAESRISGAAVDMTSDGSEPMTFSVKGAAAKLGVSQATFYELIRTGEIEHVRVGRRILISRGALEKFIEVNTRVGYYSR